jgi:hypothetical protein
VIEIRSDDPVTTLRYAAERHEMISMNRRALLVALGATSLALVIDRRHALGQPARKPARIGLVFNNANIADMTGAEPVGHVHHRT